MKRNYIVKLLSILFTINILNSCANNPNSSNIEQTDSQIGIPAEQNKIIAFKKFDINGDNFISESEYKNSEVKDFEILDLNNDKKISFQEWINNEPSEIYNKYLQEWVQNEQNPKYLKDLDSKQNKEINKDSFISGMYFQSFGKNSLRGNVIAFQPYVSPFDYSNKQSFNSKITQCLEAARKKGLINKKTIAVFPENIGTWLVASNEYDSVYTKLAFESVVRNIILSHPLDFIWTLITKCKSDDKVKESVFKIKSKQMAEIYNSTFSELSKKYNITIVAGSIILPGAKVRDNKISTNINQPLNNISAVYQPNGLIERNLIKKAYPFEIGEDFVSSANISDLPVFETPSGKLGVLISDDSWYPASYLFLKKKGVQLIAVPASLSHLNASQDFWHGYKEDTTPPDVEHADIDKIKVQQAWLKYALPGRISLANAKNGITTFLRGKLWNIGTDGSPMITENQQTKITESVEGGSIINLWL